jgi:hypothetical protein
MRPVGIAKFAPFYPAGGFVERPRLHGLLDRLSRRGPVWVHAPAGAGKTALAAAWLRGRRLPHVWYRLDPSDTDIATFFDSLQHAASGVGARRASGLPAFKPQPRQNLAAFARRFAQRLCARLATHAAVVFDEAEHVPAGSDLEMVLHAFLSECAGAVRLIITSRNPPPDAVVRLCVNAELNELDWDALRFSSREARELLRARGTELEASHVQQLNQRCNGWAAGLILLERAMQDQRSRPMPDEAMREDLFAYFAHEVFAGLVPSERRFLLRVSALPHFSVRSAALVSEDRKAAQRVCALLRRGLFIARLPGSRPRYQFHDLFRDFLRKCGREAMSAPVRRRLALAAADALEKEGYVEEAADLYAQQGTWRAVGRLLVRCGAALLSQGRNRTMLDLLSRLPQAQVERSAVLRAWRGRAQVPVDPRAALADLAAVWHAPADERAGVDLAAVWCAAIASIFYLLAFRELDLWMPRLLQELMPHGTGRGAAAPARVAATAYRPLALLWGGLPAIEAWETAAISALDGNEITVDEKLVVGVTYLLRATANGGLRGASDLVVGKLRKIADSPQASAMARVRWHWAEAGYAIWYDEDSAMQWARDALADTCQVAAEFGLGEQAYVAVVALSLALHDGDRVAANEAALRLAGPCETMSEYDAYVRARVLALHALSSRQLVAAVSHAETCMSIAERCQIPFWLATAFLVKARVQAASVRVKEARHSLACAMQVARRYRLHGTMCEARLVAALIELGLENGGRCAAPLRRAFATMAAQRYVRLPMLLCAEMAALCAAAYQRGIEPVYVRALVRIRRLRVPGDAASGAWPWPVEIRSLGGFSILRNGSPLRFSRKGPRKPLELLKLLLARGGKSVTVSYAADVLWPTREGDAAYRALLTTLSRLRALVGGEAVLLEAGKLCLNRDVVWADCFEFAEVAPGNAPNGAGALYRGEFLQGEDFVWALGRREELRRRYAAVTSQIGVGPPMPED